MVHVLVNGERSAFERAPSVLDLLELRQLAGKRIAVERNGEIVPKSLHADTLLADGDEVEIVVAVGGG